MKCETQVYHPNIDLEGNVCLNILREDWKPVLTINAVVYGLQYLFLVRKFENLCKFGSFEIIPNEIYFSFFVVLPTTTDIINR